MEGILDQIRLGKLPEQAQRAVVQGIMPLEPEELIRAIYWICSRGQDMLEDGRTTFEGLPEGVKNTFFEDKNAEPEILGFFLSRFRLQLKAKSAAILNQNTPADAIETIAPHLESELLDLAVNNQMKILENPAIIEALRKNSGLSITQTRRLEEYESLLLKELVSPAEELENQSLKEVEAAAMVEAGHFVKVFGKERDVPTGSSQERNAVKQSLFQQIATMTIPQKIQAAIKGDREIRHILIRDPNKQISAAVIRSPRLTDGEVEFYSNLRNVQAEVLRLIANNREWLKTYKVVLNLVRNPKTPIPCSMKLLHRIHRFDLKLLERDRGIPEPVRTAAKRMLRSKM